MKNIFDLSGKVAIVTGGNNGLLGPVWVEALTDAGAYIVSLDLPGFDITKDNLDDLMPWAKDVDLLVNNAGIDNSPGTTGSFFGNFDKIIDANLEGSARMSYQAIRLMLSRNAGGVIVNIGSIMGNIGADWRVYPEGFEKPVAYNCSKAALVQLSRSITSQYGRYGIRSVTISFGPVEFGKNPAEFSEKFLKNVPLGRFVSRESLKQTLLYACCCSEVAGQQIIVDGGYTAW